ncbi:MAG TPA: HAD family hydrolase [Candidatus Polarisedimenticolaceae bacterium]|nr:HAD family hydrolase [Candidatus Polarisedimenticolaceae bacterium]
MNTPITLVAFDCWGTVFTNAQKPHPFAVFAKRIGKGLTDRQYQATFEQHLMTEVYPDLKLPIMSLLEELGIPVTDKLLSDLETILLDSTHSQVAFPETLKALESLAKDYRLAMITNTFQQGFEKLATTFPIRDYFEIVITSYEEHFVKPDQHMFKTLFQRAQVRPEEVLYVGDSVRSDMDPAGELGMQTVLIDRRKRYPQYPRRITNLKQLAGFTL